MKDVFFSFQMLKVVNKKRNNDNNNNKREKVKESKDALRLSLVINEFS